MLKIFIILLFISLHVEALDNHQIARFSKMIELNSALSDYSKTMDNEDYAKMSLIYRGDIRTELNSLSKKENTQQWLRFQKFYEYQLEIKKLFERTIIYKFDGSFITYKYELDIRDTVSNSSKLILLADGKRVRSYSVDLSQHQKLFKLEPSFDNYITAYIPAIDTRLYLSKEYEQTIQLIHKLLELSHVELKNIQNER